MRVKIYAPRQYPFSAIHFFWIFKHWIDSFPLIVFEPLIKTTVPAGVARDSAFLINLHQNHIAVTVQSDFADFLHIARLLSLSP
jgi:hypothetical protein